MKVLKLALPLFLLALLSPAAQPQGGDKYAVIIGVNDYLDNPAIPDLNFCVQDAELLAQRLSEAPEGFPEGNIRLLTDGADNPKLLPTRANIMAELPTWLFLAEEGDTVLVYFSGHGIEEEGNTYLLPSEARMSNLALLAVPLDFLQTTLSNCKASQKFLILDACHSGGGRAADSVTDKTVKAIEEMTESAGMVTLASCDVKQRAYEWPEAKHGAFTWFLAEALAGAADRDANGELWASEVNDYVYRNVRKWAADQGLKQEPVKVDRSKGELVLAKVPLVEVGGTAIVSTVVEVVAGLAPGTAKVLCDVEGAKVLLDSAEVGAISGGACEVRIPPTALSQQHTVRVEMEGYSPWQSDPFTIPPGRSVEVTATLTKLEAVLEITSDPPGATINVNRIEWGKTPLTRALSSATTTAEQCTVTLELPGYETWVSLPFPMKLGDRKAINATLVKTTLPTSVVSAEGRIAFQSNRDGNREIYVMNFNGSNQTRLTRNPAGDWEPSWSPDGSKIAFHSEHHGSDDIYVMDSDGSNQTNLTSNPAEDRSPSWSPDGSKIAFHSYRDGNWEIYVMNSDGTNQTNLTNNSADDWYPSWSPDGRKIAFASPRDGDNEIYVMNSDGTNLTCLTSNRASDSGPSWSPDGRKIAFTSNLDGDTEIYVMNSNGGNPTRLTNNRTWDYSPSWSPDGRKIAFTSYRDGGLEIYVMNSDGSNQARLTNVPADDDDPSWSPF